MTRVGVPGLLLLLSACGGHTVTSPTSRTSDRIETAPTPPPAPPLPPTVPPATFQNASDGSGTCTTGYCYNLLWEVTNAGPGCATDTAIIFRAFGDDGKPGAPQLGIDIPMELPGASLRAYVWKPGVTLTLRSAIRFNDIRSAHTKFRMFESHRDVVCP